MGILEQFGIEGKLLLVQLINFLIFLVVMWKFVLPRVSGMLEARRRTVADSLKQAEAARAEAEAATKRQAEAESRTKAEAARILETAAQTATAQAADILETAKAESTALAERTAARLEADRIALREELRREVAALTVETTRKVLTDTVKPADRKRLLDAAIKQVGGKARK
jgi:F-type H+-transporting ATPase subunit b